MAETRSVTAAERKRKPTMPGTDGKFPIGNVDDLRKAIRLAGNSTEPDAKVKAWIRRRARELGAADLIPDSWGRDADDGGTAYAPHIPDEGELRTYAPTFELRDAEETADGRLTRIAGRAVPYNTPTDIGPFMEQFAPGAFAKSTREAARGLPLSLFHKDSDLESLIGVTEEWQDRSDGLHGVWRLDTSRNAQEAARLARDGFLNFLSIRFHPEAGRTRDLAKPGDPRPHYLRTAARLLAVSLVSTPAYADSRVSWVRTHDDRRHAAGKAELADWRDYLDGIRNGPPTR